jgi:hypothetical protein
MVISGHLTSCVVGPRAGPSSVADDPDTICNEANEACSPSTCGGDGVNMLPGSDCLTCHYPGAGGGYDEDTPPPPNRRPREPLGYPAPLLNANCA